MDNKNMLCLKIKVNDDINELDKGFIIINCKSCK